MDSPKADLLNGVADFAAFTGYPERKTSYLLETGQLPAGKLGRLWIGSKKKVRAHLEKIAAGEAA